MISFCPFTDGCLPLLRGTYKQSQLSAIPLSCRQIWSLMASLLIVSFFFFYLLDTKAHISWNTATPPSPPVIRCTFRQDAGQYRSQKTDEPSNKDSIFNVWSPTKNDKSQGPTATRRMRKHEHAILIFSQNNPPDSLSLVLAQHRAVGRNSDGEMYLIKKEIRGSFVFICTNGQHKKWLA